MISGNSFATYVVHYSKLKNRRSYLETRLNQERIYPTWITERDFVNFKPNFPDGRRILGINEKLVGMDLGINSRSMEGSRRTARIEGKILFLRSYLGRNNTLSTGSLPKNDILEPAWLELQRMHLTAIYEGIKSGSEWILVLEDDAIPADEVDHKIKKILNTVQSKNIWINLNSGAGLVRTKSEKRLDENGLFRIKPAATRCAVAYLISRDLAVKFVNSAIHEGIPNWLPIDFCYQVLLRKFRAKSFWIEPVLFGQGSETGEYRSGFKHFR